MGENIGAAARAMWNFGLAGMRMVAPRDGWPNPKAGAMASGAGGLLDEAQLFRRRPSRSPTRLVYATTARSRGMTKLVMTPEAAMAEAAADHRRARVSVLFGPERAGPENEDVPRADAIISVPVNPAFRSLNLAQCVLLTAYEWRRQGDAATATADEPLRAASADVGRLVDHLAEELDEAGFFYPQAKRPAMLAHLQNLFRRAPLTDAEIRTLRGVVRSLAEGPKRRR